MELFNEPIIQQKVLSDVIKNDNVITNSTMVGGSFNGGKITIGSGENIFTANKDGIFLGSSSFETAPFSVDMKGKMTASSAIISGDIESSNYTEIAPYTGYKLEYLTGKLYANDVVIRGGTIGGQAVVNVGYASDSTALASPTGLTISTTGTTTAEDGTISSYSTITWAAITGNTFREYKVRYKKSAFTYYQYVSTASNTITIEGLTPNTSYDFSVASVNKYGIESSYSATVSGSTATNGVAPVTVTAQSATAGIQYIILEWTDNTEADISSYNIYRNTTNNSGTASLIANVKTNYFVDGGRTGGTEYFYWIKAVNTSGLESASFSTVKSATPRNVTSDDVVTLAGSKVLIDGTTYLSNWRNSTDLTKIDGGNIYTGTVTTTQLNFTPVQNTNVIASINASEEGITINADNLTISSATTFSSGYDPSDKVAELGGTYDSASSGARVRIFPDANTGIQVIDDATNDVFKCLVGGTDVGDVLIGDYAHDKGMFYDKSASTFTFKGLMNAGSINGVTITGGEIKIGASPNWFVVDTSGNIWSGASDLATAKTSKFAVENTGALYASSATISGALTTGTGSSINGTYVDSIVANKITAGTGIINNLSILSTLTMGSSADVGTIQTYGWNGTANGFQINGGSTPSVSVIGGTITGGIIQTDTSGDRIVMNGSSNSLEFKNSNSLYASLEPYTLYQAGSPIGYGINIETGGLYATTPAQLSIYESTSGNTYSSITSDFIDLNGSTFSESITPFINSTYSLGSSSYRYSNAYLNSISLYGSSSGVVTFKPSSSAGTWTLTLPTSAGSNGQVLTTNGFGTTSWATPSSFSGNWSDIYINTNKDMQGYNLTGITQVIPHSSNTSFLGSASYYWDWFYVRGIYGSGGTGDITMYNNLSMYNNTIQDINSLKLRTGQTTNPGNSGEIRFYDGTGGGFRGMVGSWLGQFDMTAK